MKLRPYQNYAVQSIYGWFHRNKKAPLIVTPTGSGKSVILAEFIRGALEQYSDTKILVVTHVRELVEQDYNAIVRLWPEAPIGVYSAGLGKRQLRQITVASIQSIYSKEAFHGQFDLIIVDEAHLIPHKSDGMYRKLLDSAIAANPYTKLIGLTATPYRLDSGVLHEGPGAMFDGISYEADVGELISDGYLCQLTSKDGGEVNLEGVKVSGKEYNIGSLGERMSALELVDLHTDTIIKRCQSRNAWLIFAVTVEHAAMVCAALRRKDVTCEYVSGEMDKGDRKRKIQAFKSGELRALINCSILTTGFDHPATDAVILLRPTLSPGLFVQMVGRGLRNVYAAGFDLETKEGRLASIENGIKKNCLILDFGGNFKRHGYIDKINPPNKKNKGEGDAPVKTCPECSSIVPIMLKQCECGFIFPIKEREAEDIEHKGAVLSVQVPPEWLTVEKITYSRHEGRSGTPTMRVDYYCGLRRVSEWVCI